MSDYLYILDISDLSHVISEYDDWETFELIQ